MTQQYPVIGTRQEDGRFLHLPLLFYGHVRCKCPKEFSNVNIRQVFFKKKKTKHLIL